MNYKWCGVMAVMALGPFVPAWACSIAEPSAGVWWPYDGQIDVPRNVMVRLACSEDCAAARIRIQNVSTGQVHPVAVTQSDLINGYDVLAFTANTPLAPRQQYRITATYRDAYYHTTVTKDQLFTTGVSEDHEAPMIEESAPALNVSYFADNQRITISDPSTNCDSQREVSRPTSLTDNPVTVEVSTEQMQAWLQQEGLPAHYLLDFALPTLVDDSGVVLLRVAEYDADGVLLDQFDFAPLIRRDGVPTGTVRRYVVSATDVFGQVNPQVAVFDVRFDEAQPQVAVDTPQPGAPVAEAEAGAGCSVLQ